MVAAFFIARRVAAVLLAVAALLAAQGTAIAAPVAPPVVRLGQQMLIGVREDNGVAAFRGIAYARPPVGVLRWKAPQPLPNRRGRIDAARFGPACPQSEGNTRWYRNVAKAMGGAADAIKGPDRIDEDCLYLNIWTDDPRPLPPGQRRPVMVWIHGGSNENGYGHEPNYRGTQLTQEGVVVVSLNYRLGLLGFFAHPALGKDATGRQGLLDQVAALRWVKAHIAGFGGDPARITLFGESAGGTDIAALVSMPEANGLFSRLIIESGYLAPDGVMHADEAARFALGLTADDETAASLRAMPWQSIVALQQAKLPGHFYAPVAEWPPRLAVPTLIGSNADEYLMYLPKDGAEQTSELKAELAGFAPEQTARISSLLELSSASLARRLEMLSAAKAFHCPSAWVASTAAAAGQRVFLYRFERIRPGQHGLGAYHGAEIPYVFGTADDWLPSVATDRTVAEAMQGYWVNFARSGDPNGPGLPVWPQWGKASQTVLGLGDTVSAQPLPQADLCALLAPER
jgi:para-nitrobenzyl esterase